MNKNLNSRYLAKQISTIMTKKEISCSLGSLVCFVAFVWLALISPISDFHADTMIKFGFADFNKI